LIFYISSLPSAKLPYGINIYPIIYHILAFFCFGIFFFISFFKGKKNSLFFISGILIIISYAILDEIHQFFVLGRYCTLFDVFLDLVGISFAFMLYIILIFSRRTR